MEQINRIKTTLNEVDLNYCERAFTGEKSLYNKAGWIIDLIIYKRMVPAIAFYTNLLDDILKDLEGKGNPEGTAAVDAAKGVLKALEELLNQPHSIIILTEPDISNFSYYFGAIDGFLKNYPELLKAFKDALGRVLPHVREGLKVEVKIPLKFVILDFLGMEGGCSVEANRNWNNLHRCINEIGLEVLQQYFQHDIDEASLSETIKNELDCLEKMITKVPEPHRAQLYEILRDVRTAFDSLSQKLKALRTSCAQVVDDLQRNRKSFSDAFSELKGMLSEAEKGLSDLKERISDLERVLPSSPPMKLCELLCFMFIAILAIHSFLHLAEDKNSRVKTRWNTALYSLAVAGTIMHQMWVLWGGGVELA
ncbi:hypothetical protein [Encephalitozoon cuniculi GB-M1]|uniref:Uncharacterized protein n=1 Tax=Encephalitozoon cuniculi (strain GB-M1) TaxID=284813 RepID=Q8SWH9_ENCCU|nr:uncharacterized protein ECU02_0030 [Encephalitozoon cuniculi GB-M1]CAD25034.1 hypothetical protein [Encephalitozoon cuniculi GB-M1]